MPDLWKDRLNHESLREFALAIKSVYAAFQVDKFLKSTMDETWDTLELMARGRRISINLRKHSFADLSTRKHYPGIHSIALIVNGVERSKLDFELE